MLRSVQVIDVRNPFVTSMGTIQVWRLPAWYCVNVGEKLRRRFATTVQPLHEEEEEIVLPKQEAHKKSLQCRINIWYIRNDMTGSDNQWDRSRRYKKTKLARDIYHQTARKWRNFFSDKSCRERRERYTG